MGYVPYQTGAGFLPSTVPVQSFPILNWNMPCRGTFHHQDLPTFRGLREILEGVENSIHLAVIVSSIARPENKKNVVLFVAVKALIVMFTN